MNPKYFRIRTDRKTGEYYLTHEPPRQPMKKLANFTEEVLLCLVADLNIEPDSRGVVREIKFNDGNLITVTVEDHGIQPTNDHNSRGQKTFG